MNSSATHEIAFESLPRYAERTFVPADADLADVEQVKALYKQLAERPIQSGEDLERWILDRSEMEAAMGQTSSVLYIRMTCQTDDEARAQAYQDYIENVSPAVQPLNDELNRRHVELIKQFPLDKARYEVYNRAVVEDIKLFVEKNVPLQTKVRLLSQEYQTITGAMMVEFDGKERTLPEMGKYLLEPDRATREAAWRASAERRLQDREKLDELFGKMFVLRHEIAVNAGFPNFRDYMFKAYHRFDYTPEDCKQYHETMKAKVVPLWRSIMERRRKEMKLDKLRPWDTAVDAFNRPPLKPFEDVETLIEKTHEIFKRLSPELGDYFDDMRRHGLLDLGSRKGKAPGGYQSTLSESRKPFIFMNSVGVDQDVRTLLHEGGHAFHALACAADPIVDYRHAPMEFCEVASMAMELIGGEHIDRFYNGDDARRSKREHLEDIIHVLPWVAQVDSFQHWMYEYPDHGHEERTRKWLELDDAYGSGLVDWSGLEEFKASGWHRQLHIFEVPFYYIEYGIAQLGALQIWRNAKTDPAKALKDYLNGLSLGGARPLPELYEASGIRFDFSPSIVGPLVDLVRDEWEELV